MARHKKMEQGDTDDPALDISSLIDVCFLLLIYFLVATSITPKERKLDMEMPSVAEGTSKDQPKVEPVLIQVKANNEVVWGAKATAEVMDTNPENRKLYNLSTRLDEMNAIAKSANQNLIVQIYVEGEAKQQRVVDVMNALYRAKISVVGFTDLDNN